MHALIHLVSALLFGIAIPATPATLANADTAHVVIVSTTDVHGRATAWDYVADRPFAGGLTRVATVVDSLRRRYPGQVVVVDAGDLIQGNPFAAYFARIAPRDTNPVIRAMNVVGYDAATPGNHEFNWGLPFLARALSGARFPYVSGNIRTLPANRLAHRPYTVLERGGVRVGIAGFTTPGVMVWDRENVRGRARVTPIVPAARGVMAELRRRADLAVVVIHSGLAGNQSYDSAGVGPENVAAQLARLPSKPDLVVVGHSHGELRDSVIEGVHFVQPKNWAQSVSVVHVDLVRRGKRWVPVRWRADLVPLRDVAPAPRAVAALEGAHDSVVAWVREPLGDAIAAMPAEASRLRPTPLIGFVHAVQRKHTGARLSAAASFSTAAGLPAGPIRLGDVAGVYPYENTLRAIRITGAQLDAFLEQSARYYRLDAAGKLAIVDSIPGYNFDMVSGAEYTIDVTRPEGDRIVGLSVGGRAVAPTDTFTMAVNNYRQEGGGGFTMLRGARVVYDKGENIRDLLVDEIRARQRIDPREFADSNWKLVPATAATATTWGGRVKLRILAINDLHGALQPRVHSWSQGRPAAGIVAVKVLMDSLETACDCPTLRLDGGDQMQGTLISNLSYGRSTVAALNALGLDAAAIGNHDFDWSPDTLRARMREARYPWLAANIFDSLSGRRPDWIRPYAVVNAGNLRVAVVGYITPQTKTIVKAEHVRGLVFRGGYPSIRGALDSARATRPDAVVIVAHEGAACDTTCSGEILDLARQLPSGSVDAIVAGHTHQPVEAVVQGIPVVESRSSGTAVGVLDLPVSGAPDTSTIALFTPYADGPVQDSALAALVAGYARVADSLAARVITRLARPLPRGRTGEQIGLGNLLADAQRAATGADVAIMNNGGIRGPGLEAGPVTYGRLFELQPFQNGMVTLEVRGSVIRGAVEFAIEAAGPDVHVAGIRVRYDPSRPDGSRITDLRLENGRPLRDDTRYTLAVNDFMAGGGSGFTMLVPEKKRPTGMTDLDALLGYLARRPQPLQVDAAPRIVPARS